MNNTTSGVYSNDQMKQWNAIVRSGWPITLSTSSWAITVALMTLLYQAVVVRTFRPYTMVLFSCLSEEHREWYVDQLRVALANTNGPIAALFSIPAYRNLLNNFRKETRSAKGVSLLWLLGALVLAVFPIFLPLLLANAIPVAQGVPGSLDFCSPLLNFSNWTASARYDKLLYSDMLRSVDAHGYNYSAMNATSIGFPHDKDRVVISSDCPDWAPVCDRNNSLRVDIDFWVKQSDLGIASRCLSKNAEFGVLNTCYKVEYRRKLLQKMDDGADIYGLLYGTGRSSNGTPYVTDQFNLGERFGYGYNLFANFNTTRRSRNTAWQPNNTVAHNGDLTILFYHAGLITSLSPSDDPMFGTDSTPLNGLYHYRRAIITVICNTSYAYCPGKQGDCVSLHGNDAVGKYDFRNEKPGNSASVGFLGLMWINTWIPLFFVFAGISESIYASHTLSLGSTQLAPEEISGHAELVRLALASRMVLLTAAKRAVSGWRKYASLGVSTVETTEEEQDMCQLTLIDNPGHVTTSAWAILIVVLVGAILLLLTFTGPVLRFFFWRQLCVFTIRWRLRTAPHLHRMSSERGDFNRFWPGGAADEWPVGEGYVDRVGLVESATGYHAVYRFDANLRYAPKHTPSRSDEFPLMQNSL